MNVKESIKKHEGFSNTPYLDIFGNSTIGWGHNLKHPLCREALEIQLEADINDAVTMLNRKLDFYESLSEPIKDFLAELCFWVGIAGLLGFKKMLAAIREGDMQKAYDEFWDSKIGRTKNFHGRMTDMSELLKNKRKKC